MMQSLRASILREASVKFTRELTGVLTIRSVAAGLIRVNADDYDRPIALAPDALRGNWVDKPVAELMEADFDHVVADKPEVLLLGTGTHNLFPPRELTFAFARRGIGFETMDTAAAARTFNVLAIEGRRVVAVLYPPG